MIGREAENIGGKGKGGYEKPDGSEENSQDKMIESKVF
jgi:hypothetical protein